MSRRSTLRLFLAASALCSLALTAAPALAYPAAKVDQRIGPYFGGLIVPPLKQPSGRTDTGKPPNTTLVPCPSGNYARRLEDCAIIPVRLQASAVVDCSLVNAGDRPIEEALRILADNGILYLRGAASCRETINVDYPVIIVGEGYSAFGAKAEGAAHLAPPLGSPCIVVSRGVRLELRDINLVAEEAGQSSCIQAEDAEVSLVRTRVSYWGDGSAVMTKGGRLYMRDSLVDARTWDAAVVAEDTVVDIARTRITGESSGLDLMPGNGESKLEQVGVISRGGESPGDVGILVRGQRSGTGTLSLKNALLCGWKRGLHLDRGAQVEMSRSRICNAQWGIISAGANLVVRESAIGAWDIGAYVASGSATLEHNRFHGGRRSGYSTATGADRGQKEFVGVGIGVPVSGGAVVVVAGAGRSREAASQVYGDGRPVYVDPGALVKLTDNWVYSASKCRRDQFGPGLHCKLDQELPGSLREQGRWSNDARLGWDLDGYDYGYLRDGAPFPPAKGHGRRY